MVVARKKRHERITGTFRKPGRSASAVLRQAIKAASHEVQVTRIQALLATGLTPREVHSQLKKEFPQNTMSVQSVIYYRRKQLHKTTGKVGRPTKLNVTRKIISLRTRGVKLSAKKTAKMIKEPYTTTVRHFRRLGAQQKPIWKQPHVLSAANKAKRVRDSSSLLKILKVKKNRPFIVTGDESWIYFNNSGKLQWVFPWETPRVSTRKVIDSQKLLLVVFFSTTGFHLIYFVPDGTTVDSDYYCALLDRLNESLPLSKPSKVWLHVDNAPSHRARKTKSKLEELSLDRTPHPPYSPDLAPSDFWLFGLLKGRLEGQEFTHRAELEAAILAELSNISKPEFEAVYENWIHRLKTCIESQGEYVRDDQ